MGVTETLLALIYSFKYKQVVVLPKRAKKKKDLLACAPTIVMSYVVLRELKRLHLRNTF